MATLNNPIGPMRNVSMICNLYQSMFYGLWLDSNNWRLYLKIACPQLQGSQWNLPAPWALSCHPCPHLCPWIPTSSSAMSLDIVKCLVINVQVVEHHFRGNTNNVQAHPTSRRTGLFEVPEWMICSIGSSGNSLSSMGTNGPPCTAVTATTLDLKS